MSENHAELNDQEIWEQIPKNYQWKPDRLMEILLDIQKNPDILLRNV